MNRLGLLSLWAILSLSLSETASGISIDEFTVADSAVDTTVGTPVTGVGGSPGPDPGGVFDTREMTVEVITASASIGSTDSTIGGGVWALNNSIPVMGRTTLTYLSTTPVDLSGGAGSFRIGFLGADGTSVFTIVAHSAGGAESTAIFTPGLAADTISILFTSFAVTGYTPADFSALTSLQVIGEATAGGADIGIDSIAVPAVPEPATFVLFAIGLFGLTLLRKRCLNWS